jgi:site-specific DNA-methyltransferase (adenine-specific)
MTDDIAYPDQAYGELRAYLTVAGFTLERACQWLEAMLADDAWRRVGPGYDNVNDFMDSVRLDQFKILVEQRQRIARRINELQPKVSKRQIARTLGVSDQTVGRDLATNVAGGSSKPKAFQGPTATNVAPRLTGAESATVIERHEKKLAAAEESKARREASRAATPLPDGMDLRIGDCRKVLADVADNSSALVLTDPPFQEEARALYEWLAEWSARVLIPGGSLICYTGHWALNRDMAIFDQHLRYWWELVLMHDHGHQQFPGKFVIVGYRPVLWYVKEFRRGRSLVPDVLRSSAPDKGLHEWAKGDGGIWPLIEHLTFPGEIIVDPFAGTATWGKIAASMGRRWIGADIIRGGAPSVQAEIDPEAAP